MASKREYACFSHTNCEYFPCHEGAKRESFNCLFCYCPLYALGAACGGNFRYTKAGVKDCSGCLFPHDPKNYDKINARFEEIVRLAAKKQWEESDAPEHRNCCD